MINPSFYIELKPRILLLAFESDTEAENLIKAEGLQGNRVIFRGSLAELLDKSIDFVFEISKDVYKDYYYNSWGFSVPAKSIQSAIWEIEDNSNKHNCFNYFIVIKEVSRS